MSVCEVRATCPDLADWIQRAANSFHIACLDRKVLEAGSCDVTHLIAFAKPAQHTNKIFSILGSGGAFRLASPQSCQEKTEGARHEVYAAILRSKSAREVQFKLGTNTVSVSGPGAPPRHLASYFGPFVA